MPSRNVVKQYVPESYYHVYNRGLNKQKIFLDDRDYSMFLHLFKRHLSGNELKDSSGRAYDKMFDKIELLAFCLMPNHFHLLIYQIDENGMAELMRRVITSYSSYFNKRYQRRGALFESRYKASLIQSDSYMLHISRYIHLNPKNYKQWPFSSLPYYQGKSTATWLLKDRVLDMFEQGSYETFLEDYESYKQSLDDIGPELANS